MMKTLFATVVALVMSMSFASAGPAAFISPDDGSTGVPAIAFPSAMGFGATATVRAPNAVVYKINSLSDVANPNDGLITFRECIMALAVNTPYVIPAGRPRYCTFDVSGQIQIGTSMRVTVPKLYIAGQTSPGGIEIAPAPVMTVVDAPVHIFRTSDVVIRHLRFRGREHNYQSSINGDPLRVTGGFRVYQDHLSLEYGTDESMELSGCDNCTLAWSIWGPNIVKGSGHTSLLHGKTAFIKPGKNLTISHNLSLHGIQRALNLAPGISPIVAGTISQTDIVNNVMYNFSEEYGLISNQFGKVYANYISNVLFRGPTYLKTSYNYPIGLYSLNQTNGFQVYAKDNVSFRRRLFGQFGSPATDPEMKNVGFIEHITPASVCGINAAGATDCSINGLNVVSITNPAISPQVGSLSLLPNQIATPEGGMRNVLGHSGADRCLYGPCRDNVDASLIEDVQTCNLAPYKFATWPTGGAAAYGGYGVFAQNAPLADSDNDGMPDAWEVRFTNTNPNVADANADADGDGYTNIEEYLNDLADDEVRGDPNFITTPSTTALPPWNCGRPLTP